MLHMGFMVELTCNPEAPSPSFNLEASIEAKEVNEIYLKAERDNGKFQPGLGGRALYMAGFKCSNHI